MVVSDGLNLQAAYFYKRDRINHGKWIVGGKLYASDVKERDYGYANIVAISGDQVVISRPGGYGIGPRSPVQLMYLT